MRMRSLNEQTALPTDLAKAMWAPPLALVADTHFEALFAGYERATGIKRTLVCRVVMDDGSFHLSIRKHSKKLSTYDRFISGMSAIWPKDASWPAGIPRQAPADLSPEAWALLNEALDKRVKPRPPVPEAIPLAADMADLTPEPDAKESI